MSRNRLFGAVKNTTAKCCHFKTRYAQQMCTISTFDNDLFYILEHMLLQEYICQLRNILIISLLATRENDHKNPTLYVLNLNAPDSSKTVHIEEVTFNRN